MDKIIPEAELPIKTVAFSHCFRTEAGAAGRENRCEDDWFGQWRVKLVLNRCNQVTYGKAISI